MKSLIHGATRYRVDFKASAVKVAGFFGGLAFLLLAAYYFGLKNLKDCSGGEIVLSLLLPMLVLGAFIVLLGGVRYGGAPVYGLLSAVYCLFMIVRAVGYDSKVNMFLAILWYLIAAAACVGTSMGYLSTRVFMVLTMLCPAVFRLLFLDIRGYLLAKNFVGFLPEASALCGLLAFGVLAMCLKPAEPREGETPKPEAPQRATSRLEIPQRATSRLEIPQRETPRPATPQREAPRPAAPKPETDARRAKKTE